MPLSDSRTQKEKKGLGDEVAIEIDLGAGG